MPFFHTIGEEIPKDTPIFKRIGVRAIISKGDELLMMRSKRGDYKFPGGGVEGDEAEDEALRREIMEETGYVDITITEKLGEIIQRHPDRQNPNAWYEQRSPYYRVTLNSEKQVPLQLTVKELHEGFTHVWIAPEDAIKANEHVTIDPKINGYIARENWVLRTL